MLKQSHKLSILIGFAVFMFNGILHADKLEITNVKIQADSIFTDIVEGEVTKVFAFGNVQVSYRGTDAKAEFVEFEVKNKRLELRGPVVFTRNEHTLEKIQSRSQKTTWDLKAETIDMGPYIPIIYEKEKNVDP